jgi:WXG100 family type VII secretion target
MSQIVVQSSAQFESMIDELEAKRVEFVNKANALDTEHLNVTTKWQGDASTAMNDHWMKKRQNFQTLNDALVQYVQALRDILANYEAAEEKNKGIAEN